jgi:hypothetical protein
MSTGAGEAMDRLRRLRGVLWEWREEAPADAKEQPGMGVIAQEVEAVFPELIELTAEGIRRVEYDGLVPPLMLAVVDLDRRLRAFETKGGGVEDETDREGAERASPSTERIAAAAGQELRTELDPDEIAKVFPQLVVTDESGERVVAYEGLVGLLIEAVKELDARVRALEDDARGTSSPTTA